MKRKTKEAFYWITELLDNHKIPYRLSGGFAAKLYGANRELADIDLDIDEFLLNDSFMKQISPYIIFGPEQYTDDSWDLFLITLEYMGQEIDLAGTHNTKIYDVNTKSWTFLITDFNDNETLKVFEKEIKVIKKDELIAYKSKLSREVDIFDIKSID